jgi:acetyl-CoA carboxylase carboxyltransferase component
LVGLKGLPGGVTCLAVEPFQRFEKRKLALKPLIDELRERVAKAQLGGGHEAIKKQHDRGKMTARERIDFLVDEGTFVELDAFAESRSTEFGMDRRRSAGDGVVTGAGKIDGNVVYLSSQDFTALGGSLGEMHADKICRAMDLAVKAGCPFIQINDSGGARIQEGVSSLNGYGKIFRRNTLASGVIPQIAVILGPCAGGAVYSPAICDFIFMVPSVSNMFVTGPDVIKAVTGEEITFEALGGAGVHGGVSGVSHFTSANERECLLTVKKLLGFLPSNNVDDPPRSESPDHPPMENEALEDLIPVRQTEPYDVHDLIEGVFDHGDFLEVHADFAKNAVVGFARLGGHSVGVIANQPSVLAGVLDIDSSDKVARMVRFCDSFNLPVITFVDVPGFLPGSQQEFGGIIRHGAKILFAYSEATVPKVSIIVRKAYGGAYIAFSNRDMGFDRVLAYPTAEIAVMGPEGAANIIFRREIAEAEDPEAKRQALIEEFRKKFCTPYSSAALGLVDAVIEPRHTRRELLRALEMLQGKQESRPRKKHGNIPL